MKDYLWRRQNISYAISASTSQGDVCMFDVKDTFYLLLQSMAYSFHGSQIQVSTVAVISIYARAMTSWYKWCKYTNHCQFHQLELTSCQQFRVYLWHLSFCSFSVKKPVYLHEKIKFALEAFQVAYVFLSDEDMRKCRVWEMSSVYLSMYAYYLAPGFTPVQRTYSM